MDILYKDFLNTTTRTVHASTNILYHGVPIYSWFGSNISEGAFDCNIYIQHDKDVISIPKEDNLPRWNPILFCVNDRLFIFFKSGKFCDSWQTFYLDISDINNDDFDISKCNINILPCGLNFAVKTKPLIVGDYIYCGSSTETLFDWTSYVERYKYEGCFELNSRSLPLFVDKIKYQMFDYGNRMSLGIIQPSIFYYNNKLNAFFRSSHGLNKIYYSYCEDIQYNIWSKPLATNFDNPNSSIDTIVINDRLFLSYNPSKTLRSPLSVVELNGNMDIIDNIIIENNVSGKTVSKELSYPYMYENDCNIQLTYTYGRSNIRNVTIKI